jgi:anti-sigma factor (TIGR02949 family)
MNPADATLDIDCATVLRVLQAYLDGEADAALAMRVARHLGACTDCEREADAFRSVIGALHARADQINDSDVTRLRTILDDIIG